MSHLKSIYGKNIPNPSQMLRTKWGSNEFTFGSYSFATNGTRSADFEAFEGGVDNKLFFAGEHTSRDYRGTVHGAYLSGIREAKPQLAKFFRFLKIVSWFGMGKKCCGLDLGKLNLH